MHFSLDFLLLFWFNLFPYIDGLLSLHYYTSQYAICFQAEDYGDKRLLKRNLQALYFPGEGNFCLTYLHKFLIPASFVPCNFSFLCLYMLS